MYIHVYYHYTIIYLQNWVIYGGNVGTYASTMVRIWDGFHDFGPRQARGDSGLAPPGKALAGFLGFWLGDPRVTIG